MKLSNDFPIFEDRPIYNPRLTDCHSISVVGNSGGLFYSSYGRKIDSSEKVIRMNAAPTEGYEKKVGSKTSYRFINGLLQKGKTLEYTTTPREWISKISDQDLLFMPVTDKTAKYGKDLAGDENEIYVATDQFKSYIKDDLKGFFGNYPSSGIICSVIALLIANRVQVYGMGFHDNPGDKVHYWEDWERENTSHNWKKESETLELLENRFDNFRIVK